MKEYSGSPNIIEKNEKSPDEEPRDEQSLLKQMLRFQERDRQLIAYEIHDGLDSRCHGGTDVVELFNEKRQFAGW